MVQLGYTSKNQINPLYTYIDKSCITISFPLHVGEGETEFPRHISCIDHDCAMRKNEFCRVQHSQVGVVVHMSTHAFDLSIWVGWCEILSWYLVDWARIMDTVVVETKTKQDILEIGDIGGL